MYLRCFFAIFFRILTITFDTSIFAVKDGGHIWSHIPYLTAGERIITKKLIVGEKKFVPFFSIFTVNLVPSHRTNLKINVPPIAPTNDLS